MHKFLNSSRPVASQIRVARSNPSMGTSHPQSACQNETYGRETQRSEKAIRYSTESSYTIGWVFILHLPQRLRHQTHFCPDERIGNGARSHAESRSLCGHRLNGEHDIVRQRVGVGLWGGGGGQRHLRGTQSSHRLDIARSIPLLSPSSVYDIGCWSLLMRSPPKCTFRGTEQRPIMQSSVGPPRSRALFYPGSRSGTSRVDSSESTQIKS